MSVHEPIRVLGTTMKQLLMELVVLGTSCHSPIVAAEVVLAVDAVVDEAGAVEIAATGFSLVIPAGMSPVMSDFIRGYGIGHSPGGRR